MALSFAAWPVLLLVLLPLVVLVAFYIHFKLEGSKYWARRNVPHMKPKFLLGNMAQSGFTKNLFEVMEDIHLQHKEKKLVGLWFFTKPQLMVTDVELTKRILVRDFNMFRDRGFEINTDLDPLAAHLFVLSGAEWRNLRVKLTPTFTSGKMKLMFPIIAKCGEELQKQLAIAAERKSPVEVKDLMSRFTIDNIGSCAFGIETNSLQDPDSEFRKHGKDIFKPRLITGLVQILTFFYPRLAKLFSIRIVQKETTEFFINAVRDTVEYREKNNQVRNDFLQLLIQLMREGKVEDADRNKIDVKDLDDEAVGTAGQGMLRLCLQVKKFTLNDAAAQCFVFFAAGFETSSSTLMFALYELALNPDIQKKLQKEIDEEVKKRGITYEGMMDMEYLDMVVQETLRKHPPAGNLQRISNSEYHIPEFGITLDKGTTVIISLRGFHHDPDLYPEPERFDPERFSAEGKSQRDSWVFLPFGEGPRKCIGNRFALMQVKLGLIFTLKDFTVEPTKSTPLRISYNPRAFVPLPNKSIPLALVKRY